MEERSTLLTIRPATAADAPAFCQIYNPFIADTIVSFETEPVTHADMQERIRRISAEYLWLTAEGNARVAGYAYATRWRTRAAYDHTVEVAIYVHPDARGQGVGRVLYSALFAQLRQRGIHAVIGGVSLPNEASVAFHEACGFKPIGIYPEVGRKFDRWIDVGFWQLML
jgi:phosphinothricin acetyltransferase